jgi:hypothetical protein
MARRAFGRSTAGAMLSIGSDQENLGRRLDVTNNYMASGTRLLQFVTGVIDVTHDFNLGSVTVTPDINLGITSVNGNHSSETGAGAQDAVLLGHSELHVWTEPNVVFGFGRSLSKRLSLRAYARVGVLQYLNGASTDVLAGLEGAPPGVAPMRITSHLDHAHVIVEGGFEVTGYGGMTLGLSYASESSGIRDSGTTSMRLSVPFH